MAKGRAETLAQVARDMLQMNMPVKEIMKITKLTEDENKRL